MSLVEYVSRRWEELLVMAGEHLLLVVVPVGVAVVLGVVLGVAAYRSRRTIGVLLAVTGALFTVPALAYFGFLFTLPFLGLGFTTAAVPLVVYALLPITRNTITGLREVDPAVVRSAEGMGMGRVQRLLRIELPLAWPVILTGIRIGTLLTVGIAAIADFVDGGGLGGEIFGGLGALGSARAVPQATSGLIGVILIAVVLDATLTFLGRVTTPRGLR